MEVLVLCMLRGRGGKCRIDRVTNLISLRVAFLVRFVFSNFAVV